MTWKRNKWHRQDGNLRYMYETLHLPVDLIALVLNRTEIAIRKRAVVLDLRRIDIQRGGRDYERSYGI